jgi:hypothetical protein
VNVWQARFRRLTLRSATGPAQRAQPYQNGGSVEIRPSASAGCGAGSGDGWCEGLGLFVRVLLVVDARGPGEGVSG